MKRISIKRKLAVMLAVLLMLQNQSAIASENQANEAAEKQTDGWSRGTEEASGSNDRGSLDNDREKQGNRKEPESEKKRSLDADVIATPNNLVKDQISEDDLLDTSSVQPYTLERSGESVVIGEGTTRIDSKAFLENKSLINVIIADSVTSIGELAFDSCYNLTDIYIPDGVTDIGRFAFGHCPRLRNINISKGLMSIPEFMFVDCNSLTSIHIPDNITSIEQYAFGRCSSLRDVNIPDSVTYIGVNAFTDCSNLTSIDIPDSVTLIDGAFSNSGLKHVEFHGTSTNIGGGAFSGCSELEEINILGGSIGNHAFMRCSNLTKVVLSEGVEEIGEKAFASCSNLKEIEIPSSVTSIGDRAFGFSDLNFSSDDTPDYDIHIMGMSGSVAEEYAARYGLTFIPLDTLVDPVITTTEIPDGVQYAPYEALIENSSTYSWNTVTYSIKDGVLPSGIELDPHKGLYGVPMETGTFTFTVHMENSFSRFPDREKTFSMTVIANTDQNVADYTDMGYEITQRAQDMPEDLTYEQAVVSQGSFDEFTTVFIDGVELISDVDYTAEEDSTRITIRSQTFQRFNSVGLHTIGIEFRSRDRGLLKRAVQNYVITASNSGSNNNSGSSGNSGNNNNSGSNNNGGSNNNSGGNNNGGSSSNNASSTESNSWESDSNDSSAMVVFDRKKGYVHAFTGIIIREWKGYSHWIQDEKGWKLIYADGTEARGYIIEQEDGSTVEQVLWELIEGKWYAFGEDGYSKFGWVYDYRLGRWYMLSVNTGMAGGWYKDPVDQHTYYLDPVEGGMSTGWRTIDSKWYYFNTKVTGASWELNKETNKWQYNAKQKSKPLGAMLYNEKTPDGYYVNADGVWDGKKK